MHSFILESINYNAGCPANGEEMIFTSLEVMGKYNHTPVPSETQAVNFTSASPLLQPMSEATLMYYG